MVRRRQHAALASAAHGGAGPAGPAGRATDFDADSGGCGSPRSPTCVVGSSSGTSRRRCSAVEGFGIEPRLVFLEADDDTLVRRFESSRRPHPLQGEGRLVDGIAAERALLASLRESADLLIDTSPLNVHQLRTRIETALGHGGARPVQITVMSFGFKYGLPVDADFVADCRFLPNPYWVPELRPLTGEDPVVAEYVLGQPDAAPFLDAYETGAPHRARGLPHREQALRHGGAGVHRGQAPQRRPRRPSSAGGSPPRASPSASSTGTSVVSDVEQRLRLAAPAVVAFGGGHGLAASLAALRRVTPERDRRRHRRRRRGIQRTTPARPRCAAAR